MQPAPRSIKSDERLPKTHPPTAQKQPRRFKAFFFRFLFSPPAIFSDYFKVATRAS
jgi:hypothetical protein